jgi:predicted TIM-barrel fold metal-dependent hydrolase
VDFSQTPDTRTSVPNFAVPAGTCDAHCHVFGPSSLFPYAPDRTYTPADAPKERLAALHATLGIERAVIVQASCHGTDNRAMLDAIASSGGRYRGIAIVDASHTVVDFGALHDGGIRGVRFNFVKHLGGSPEMTVFHRVVERIQALGWHLVVHLDAADIAALADVLRSLPVPFIIDHMGRIDARAGLEQGPFRALLKLAELETCWIKVSGSERVSSSGPPFLDAVPFARAIVDAAPDRVLWGTDWPHPNVGRHLPNDGALMDLVPLIAPDTDLRRKLLVDNPARLYGFAAHSSRDDKSS